MPPGQAAYWRRRMGEALELCQRDENLEANYAPSIQDTIAALDGFLAGTKAGWDQAAAALPIPFPTVGRKKIVDDPAAAERVKAIRNTCKKRLEKLEDWFSEDGAGLLEGLRAVYPAVRGLFALVKDFEAAYTAEKKRRSLLDFSDLEHLAVALLVGEDGAPTPLARQWGGRYDEIMVDEYQDTKPGAERHFHRTVQRRHQPVSGGGREAVHLPVPAGRPHHFSGQVSTLYPL